MLDVNINDLKNMLNTALAFSKEVTFYVDKNTDMLHIKMIDPAHVAMIIASAPLTSKPDVDCFTVNVEQMLKALSMTDELTNYFYNFKFNDPPVEPSNGNE